MVTRNYTPEQFQAEREKAERFGIHVPEVGENTVIDWSGFKIRFTSKVEEDKTITTTTEVLSSPWYEPKAVAEKVIEANE